MKFSLILATLDRPKLVKECLESLAKQSFTSFEVIVIDQSDDNKTKDIVSNINLSIDIKYKKIKIKGLSKARNIGLSMSEGEYIGLIDDDARYKENYLEIANNILKKYNYDEKLILSGKIVDDTINEEFVNYNIVKNEEILNNYKIFKVCLSAALIINTKQVKSVGGFDERLGIGEYFGSAEESDLILKLADKNSKVLHLSNLIVYHLKPQNIKSESYLKKTYYYALGAGALLKKHIVYNKNISLIPIYLRSLCVPFIKLLINIGNKYEIKKNVLVIKGHVNGFLEFKETK